MEEIENEKTQLKERVSALEVQVQEMKSTCNYLPHSSMPNEGLEIIRLEVNVLRKENAELRAEIQCSKSITINESDLELLKSLAVNTLRQEFRQNSCQYFNS